MRASVPPRSLAGVCSSLIFGRPTLEPVREGRGSVNISDITYLDAISDITYVGDINYGDKPMRQFRPTKTDADAARFVLSISGIKARVKLLRFSVRICLEGDITDEIRTKAREALADADLRGVLGGELSFAGGYQAFAYKVL